jgi:hypothetical protein
MRQSSRAIPSKLSRAQGGYLKDGASMKRYRPAHGRPAGEDLMRSYCEATSIVAELATKLHLHRML